MALFNSPSSLPAPNVHCYAERLIYLLVKYSSSSSTETLFSQFNLDNLLRPHLPPIRKIESRKSAEENLLF
jgi:hypothetical protein